MISSKSLTEHVNNLLAALYLRAVDQLGTEPAIKGRPLIANGGTIRIGKNFRFISRPAESHLVAFTGGTIDIGDRVTISHGAAISSKLAVRIGDDCKIAPFCVIMDNDFHVAGDRNAEAPAKPVWIGRRVHIGSCATVLGGSTIGDDAQVLGGSVVSGTVQAGALVSGVPARQVIPHFEGAIDGSGNMDLTALVMRVLGLASPPDRSQGPDQIGEWDSLGSLKLFLAIEETFGITLSETDMQTRRTIMQWEQLIGSALSRQANERQS